MFGYVNYLNYICKKKGSTIMDIFFKNERDIKWKDVNGTDGKYLISNEARIINKRPHWGHLKCDDDYKPREIEISDIYQVLFVLDNGRHLKKSIWSLMREHFPELCMSDKEMEELRNRIEYQDSITLDEETFNRIIFPNEVVVLYDTTSNSRKPYRKPRKMTFDNGKITFFKNRTYCGLGTRNVIYFRNHLPKNGKPYEVSNGSREKKKK